MLKRKAASPLPFLPRGGKRRKLDKSRKHTRVNSKNPLMPKKIGTKELRELRKKHREEQKRKKGKGIKDLKAEIEAMKSGPLFPPTHFEDTKGLFPPTHFEDTIKRKLHGPPDDYGPPIHGRDQRETCNLHVGNIPSHVLEDDFVKVFSAFGNVTSVRFMCPRQNDGNRKSHAFVNYAQREDAEEALKKLKGALVWDVHLRFDWGHKLAPPPTRQFQRAPPPPPPHKISQERYGYRLQRQPLSPIYPPPGHPRVHIYFPPDPQLRQMIDCLSEHVAEMGMEFESVVILKEQERQTGRFDFLFQVDTQEHMYYRWRCWSLAMGETIDDWTEEPFQMIIGGPFWIPPPLESRKLLNVDPKTLPKIEPPPRREPFVSEIPPSSNKKKFPSEIQFFGGNKPANSTLLNDGDRERYICLLQKMKPSRKSVREVMCLCFDLHQYAEEICNILGESFATKKLNIPRKLARLYLVNDLLFNSNSFRPGKKYRRELKTKLEEICTNLHNLHSRLSGEAQIDFKRRVVQLFDIWERNSLYTKPYVDRLRENFAGNELKI